MIGSTIGRTRGLVLDGDKMLQGWGGKREKQCGVGWGRGQIFVLGVVMGTKCCPCVTLYFRGPVVKPLVLSSIQIVGCSKNHRTNTYWYSDRFCCWVVSYIQRYQILHASRGPTSFYRLDRLTRQTRLPQTHHSELPSPKCHREIGYGNQ